MTKTFFFALILALAPRLAAADEVIIASSDDLAAALASASAGRTIHVTAGNYVISQPLVVPDGVTVVGEGVMLRDADGLPAGFAPGQGSRLKASAALDGDILTLGNGASLVGLEIEDLNNRPTGGNLVVVSSRAPGDTVSASIFGCELVQPSESGVAPNGPMGRGVLVVTRNPRLPPAPPHTGAQLSLTMSGSIVRSPRSGSGVFAVNFAPQGRVTVVLDGNVIGGGLDTAGGVSRPRPVSDASTTIISTGNLYRSDTIGNAPAFAGISLNGGSGPPFVIPGIEVPPTERNHLSFLSTGDRIEGFFVGIYAVGGRRFHGPGMAGPSNFNRTDVSLAGSRIQAVYAGYMLFGAESVSDQNISPGSGNVLSARATGVSAQSRGGDLFADAMGPLGPLSLELTADNRLVIDGDL